MALLLYSKVFFGSSFSQSENQNPNSNLMALLTCLTSRPATFLLLHSASDIASCFAVLHGALLTWSLSEV